MLVIRLQRVGRKGLAQFRVVVQDSRRTPTSGKIVAPLGHYNPHTKEIVINKEKTQFYLDHGAQPSDRVVVLLKKEAIKLPKWVAIAEQQKRTTRNPEKLRKNQPKEEALTESEAPIEVAEAAKPEDVVVAPAEETTTKESSEA